MDSPNPWQRVTRSPLLAAMLRLMRRPAQRISKFQVRHDLMREGPQGEMFRRRPFRKARRPPVAMRLRLERLEVMSLARSCTACCNTRFTN